MHNNRRVREAIRKHVLARLPVGLVLVLKQLEVVIRSLVLKRYYEPEERLLLDLLARFEGKVAVLDVGANLGQYAMPIARSPKCTRIICIEPQSMVARLLRIAIRLTQTRSVEVVEACAGETTGSSYLRVPKANGCVAGQETHMSDVAATESATKVPVLKLDDITSSRLASGERVGVVKMDVEGAELRVLKGAEGIIDSFQPIILAELEDRFLNRYDTSFDQVLRWLDKHGYSSFYLLRGRLHPIESGSAARSSTANYLFLPNTFILPRHLRVCSNVPVTDTNTTNPVADRPD